MTIDVILNASSGAGRQVEIRERLTDAFKASGADVRICLAGDGLELVALARRAARGDAGCVVAGHIP
jgi:diacylglycerol kinase family enzyme